MTQTLTERLHIIEGSPWKDAVISLLDSRSSYRPWRFGFGEAHVGDPVAVVLRTDPPSVLTGLGRIGADGQQDRALVNWPRTTPGLLDLATLAAIGGFEEDPRDVWVLRGDAASRIETTLADCAHRHDDAMRLGHSEIAKARILLHSEGRCTGCLDDIDLTTEDTRDAFHIHTVDAPSRAPSEPLVRTERDAGYLFSWPSRRSYSYDFPVDVPGVLCAGCRQNMHDEGHGTLLDFKFAQHPRCPQCRAMRTRRAVYGLRTRPVSEPWLHARGCVVMGDHTWTCGECDLEW